MVGQGAGPLSLAVERPKEQRDSYTGREVAPKPCFCFFETGSHVVQAIPQLPKDGGNQSLGVSGLVSGCWMISVEEYVSQVSGPQPYLSSHRILLLSGSEPAAFSHSLQIIPHESPPDLSNMTILCS